MAKRAERHAPFELSDSSGDVAAGASPRVVTRGRRVLPGALLGIATLLTVFAIFAVWANRQLMNPSNWSKTSTALLQRQPVRAAASGYLVDQLYKNVDVPAELRAGLPSQLKALSGPLAGGLRNVAERGTERVLESAKVQSAWGSANRAADESLVAVVNGGTKQARIQGGTVSLDLHSIVAELGQRLGVSASVAGRLPPSVGNLKVITADQLGTVRTLAKALHALALTLTILALVLFTLSVAVARGNRRRWLMRVGACLVLDGLLVLAARAIAQTQLVPAITSDASLQEAVVASYSVATSLLVEVATAVILVGIPIVLAAWFAGPAGPAVAGRRLLAPYLRKQPSLAYWAAAVFLALIFIWDPIPATRNPIEMLIFVAMAFGGAYVLRNQIAAEFPDAEHISVRSAVDTHARAPGTRQAARRRRPAKPTTAASVPVAGELERLSDLRDRGALTADEYEAAKRELLTVG